VIAQHVAQRRCEVRLQPVFGQTRVAHRLIELQRIDDLVTGERIHHQPLAVGGDDFFRRRIEIENALVDEDHVLNEGQLEMQPRLRDELFGIAELQHDRLLRHADDECGGIGNESDKSRNDAKTESDGFIHDFGLLNSSSTSRRSTSCCWTMTKDASQTA